MHKMLHKVFWMEEVLFQSEIMKCTCSFITRVEALNLCGLYFNIFERHGSLTRRAFID